MFIQGSRRAFPWIAVVILPLALAGCHTTPPMPEPMDSPPADERGIATETSSVSAALHENPYLGYLLALFTVAALFTFAATADIAIDESADIAWF